MRTARLIAPALALTALVAASIAHAEVPEQFRVWGRRAADHPHLQDPAPFETRDVGFSLSHAEAERGFCVFGMPPTAIVLRTHFATPAERVESLRARDCPGQYGPVTFGVMAGRAGSYAVEVTALTGPGGTELSRENLDLRAVRYVRPGGGEETPLLLESVDSVDVPEGAVQQFWITYYIPEDAAPGDYEGKVAISVDGREQFSLPLTVTVYPFALAEAGIHHYIYYWHPDGADAIDRARMEWIDQRCHGMNMGMIVPPVTRDGDLTAEALAPFLDAYKEAGFAGSRVFMGLWNRVTAEWLNEPDRSIGMWGPWFRYYPLSEELDARYVRTVRMIHDEAKARGLEVALSVGDEAGSHAWTIEAVQHYNDLLKAEVPEVLRELTVGGGWAMDQPEHELWRGRLNIWTTNRWLEEQLLTVQEEEPDIELQLYNMGGAGSAPGSLQPVRALYGFFAWRARARGVAQWVYHHRSTPEHNYVWPARDPAEGNVPTLHWEALREGAKDRRYMATFRRHLQGKQGRLAFQAGQFMSITAADIRLASRTYDAIEGGQIPALPPSTYDSWRARMSEYIIALEEAAANPPVRRPPRTRRRQRP